MPLRWGVPRKEPSLSVIAVIPARFASTRLPGKPLLRETGRTLIQHVYEQVAGARRVERCLVATDDRRIAEAVESFGGEAVMTRADHASGTDRIAEVVEGLRLRPDAIVLNVQGDEPEIEPAVLDRLIERLERDPQCTSGTLACPFPQGVDPGDPARVKVVCDGAGRALYFSRSLVPYCRERGGPAAVAPLLHVGVYAYRSALLLRFSSWDPTPLERCEMLEQLRVLEHGEAMAVEIVEHALAGVDTPQDYERFVARYRARQSQVTAHPEMRIGEPR